MRGKPSAIGQNRPGPLPPLPTAIYSLSTSCNAHLSIYIHKRTRITKSVPKSKTWCFLRLFASPLSPQNFSHKTPYFLHFSAIKPHISPSFQHKNTHSAHKKHTNTGISMSFAPAFANGRYISVRDAGAAPSVVGVPAVHPAIGAGHCRHTKTDLTTIFLQQRYYAPL